MLKRKANVAQNNTQVKLNEKEIQFLFTIDNTSPFSCQYHFPCNP